MKDDGVYLGHIRLAVGKVLEYAAVGEEVFHSDPRTQDAILRNLEIVGEASKRLSPELKAAHNDIPWRQIGGMRDKLIHDYFGVDLQLVWRVVTDVLPSFERRIAEIETKPRKENPAID